jgi:GT2 family glycosyltransferase
VIVSFNTRELLCGCLRSIERASTDAQVDVIVVDNASSDGSVEAIAQEFPAVQVIRLPENVGFAAANNRAFKLVQSPYVFVLNPDTLIVPGTLGKLKEFLENHPQAAVAGAGLTYPDGTAQASTFGFPTLRKEFLNFLPEIKTILQPRKVNEFFGRLIHPRRFSRRMPGQADVVSGAAFLARTDVIRQIGGFDEGFFLYHEEADLCRRLWDQEWEVWSVPGAQVIHFNAQATGYRSGRFPKSPVLCWRIGGMDRYWHKHRSAWIHGLWRTQARALMRLRIGLNWIIPGRNERRAELRQTVGMLTGKTPARQSNTPA